MESKVLPEKTVRNIRRKTRKKHLAKEKSHIVLEDLQGEDNIANQLHRAGIKFKRFNAGISRWLILQKNAQED
jgi:hypothetical protein